MSDFFTLFIRTSKLDVEIHKHSAYQIVYTIDNAFTSTIDNTEYKNISGFIIKPQVKHLCQSSNSTMEILNIEPASEIGNYISRLFSTDTNAIVFSENITKATKNITIDAVLTEIKHQQAKIDFNENLDKRVIKIIQHIKNEYSQNLTPKIFSELVFISPSRLSTLFKEQTGSSISKFILWTRLKQAITKALSNKEKTLTEIAYETGFYDLPQLNKYMYEMFGVSPKILKENSDLIQAL